MIQVIQKLIDRMQQAFRRPFLASPIVNPQCSEFEVNNWVLSDFVITRLVPIVGVHPYPLNELLLMAATVNRLQPDQIFEWGTHFGSSARIFYETTKYFGLKCTINSIDLPESAFHIEHPHKDYAKLIKDIKPIQLYRGDGLEISQEIAGRLPADAGLLFFLDGDHSYETVLKELLHITEHFAAAAILLHDTFYQSSESGYNIGPYRAIEDVRLKFPAHYKKIETKTGLPGMTLLIPSVIKTNNPQLP